MRSCTSGIAASSNRRWSGVIGSSTSSASARNGITRSVMSGREIRRMWALLIASSFFMSKRAGLGLTRLMSNASAISCIVKMSRSSAMPQPSRAR